MQMVPVLLLLSLQTMYVEAQCYMKPDLGCETQVYVCVLYQLLKSNSLLIMI